MKNPEKFKAFVNAAGSVRFSEPAALALLERGRLF
jgi:hypothetical protein